MGRMGLAALVALVAAPSAWAAAPKLPAGPPMSVPPVIRPAPPKPAPQEAPAASSVVYEVEQLITAVLPPAVTDRLKPLNTLAEVETFLKTNGVPFAWRKANMDTARLDPRLVKMIGGLPPGEVFILPDTQQMYINVIIGQRTDAAPATPTGGPR